jgi:hypothetical protein
MPDSWTISVGGRVYGPYGLEQMRDFQAEGRLAGHSLVARSDETQFHPAHEDADLASLFAAPREGDGEPAGEDVAQVLQDGPVADDPGHHGGPHRFGRSEPEASCGPTRYVIIADMKSRSIAGLEEEIFNMGPAYRFMPQAWVLSSEASLNAIRNCLVQKLGKIDMLFIVDTAHDKAAWFNFGPENDARVRRMWSRPREYGGTERRTVRRA